MNRLGWIVLGIALAAIGGYVIYRLWERGVRADQQAIWQDHLASVRATGTWEGLSAAPAAIAGTRMTIATPGPAGGADS